MAAQLPSAGVIPNDRVTDWSYAGVHVDGVKGIPQYSVKCITSACQALEGAAANYKSGVDDATSLIQNALSSAPPESFVFLPAGTYLTSSSISFGTKRKVVVRGAGMGTTTIRCAASGSCFSNTDIGFGAGVSLTGNTYSKGTTSVQVSNLAGFSDGQLIRFDINDNTDLVSAANGPARYIKFLSRITSCGASTEGAACTGTSLQFFPPLAYDLPSNLAPQVAAIGGSFAQHIGIEDLTINNVNGATDIVRFMASLSPWVKNVEILNTDNAGSANNNSFVTTNFVLQGEMRDCYVHHAENAPCNDDGFGIYSYNNTTYLLVENNIFDEMFVGTLQSASTANVFIYNFVRNGVGKCWPHQIGNLNSNHGAHPIMTLWEGNVGEQWQNDGYHGSGSHQTLFRNWIHGVHPTYTTNRKMLDLPRGSYFHTVVGNVLGSSWATSSDPKSKYEFTPGVIGYDEEQVIYRLGFPNVGNNDLTASLPWPYPRFASYPDQLVKNTLMRWGNYDYYTAGTRWLSSELPSGVPVPANQTLPSSLLYSARPSWWPVGSAWPPIGPEVTGGNADPAGKVHKIPAQVRYEQLTIPRTVTVSKNGTGSGTITSNPAGIQCGISCSTNVSGAITLTATSASNSTFMAWGGACSGSAPTCQLQVLSNQNVTATFTMLPLGAPTVTIQPQSQTKSIGSSATFTVEAVGNPGTFSYQWQRNGADISAATSATYTTPILALADNGAQYRVRVTNSQGSTLSNPAVLSVSTIFQIGETAVLSDFDGSNADKLHAQSAVLNQAGSVISLSFYVTHADGDLRLGVYDSSGPSGGPGLKVAETLAFTPVFGWNTANVMAPINLTPGTYWLAYLPSSNNLAFLKSANSSSSGRYFNYQFGVLPQVFSTNPTSTPSHWSLYATLTASGGSSNTAPSAPVGLQLQ